WASVPSGSRIVEAARTTQGLVTLGGAPAMDDALAMLRWLFWLVLLPVTLPIGVLRSLVWALSRRDTLELTLRGALTDVPSGSRFSRAKGASLLSWVAALASAETDPKLTRVLVKIEGFRGGLGRAEELRSALERV